MVGDGLSNAINAHLVGGAFYDLASQCLTPLVGCRGGKGLASVVQATRLGDVGASLVSTLEGSEREG